jgi:hypothetical protein
MQASLDAGQAAMDTAVPPIIPDTAEKPWGREPQRQHDNPARAKSVPGASLRDIVVPAGLVVGFPRTSMTTTVHCKRQKPALGV